MSSEAVRSAVRSAWSTLTPTVPYLETINVPLSDDEIAQLPTLWGSLTFVAERDSYVTMGSTPWKEEIGTFSVVLFGGAGLGDADVSQAATAVRNAWEKWITADGSIWVREISGPRPVQESVAGNWLVLAMDMSYSYQRRL